jgi:PAS domain S-box-containing protein
LPCNQQVLTVVRDITDRRRGEAELRRSEDRYVQATSAAGVGVWDWNLGNSSVYVDDALKAVLGYQGDEIAGDLDSWMRLVHPDDVRPLLARAEEHVAGKRPLLDIEHRILHRDGSIHWFHARGSIQQHGETLHLVGTSSDVTERKRSELALQEAQADLARVSRLTALGEFATSISHEVRQPLTAILVNARAGIRLLGEPSPDLIEVRAALSDVVEAAGRTEELIRRNRELFTQHTVKRTTLDCNALIRDVLALAGSRLHAHQITLGLSLGPSLPPIHGDSIQLQQVLLNLVTNAIEALHGQRTAAPRIDIATSVAPSGSVKVSVSDNGIGLGGVDLQKIFTVSYTTKANGSGIGLSISQSIVEAHGGALWAEPDSPDGATFCFTIPAETALGPPSQSVAKTSERAHSEPSAIPEIL